MPIVSCKECGARVSNEYSYCTNCGALISAIKAAHPSRRRKVSSETRQGALVGAFVGVLHGIAASAYLYFIFIPIIMPLVTQQVVSDPRFANDPRFVAMLPQMLGMLDTIMHAVAFLAVPLEAVLGSVLGFLFVKIRKHIPGASIIRKSVVFSFILLGISFAISFLSMLRAALYPASTITFETSFSMLRAESFALTLVEYPVLGWLFGFLLDRRLKN